MSKKKEEYLRLELLEFIEWKLRHDTATLREEMPTLKKMSYEQLIRWATARDIIDY